MAIFNSYVKLPEGSHSTTLARSSGRSWASPSNGIKRPWPAGRKSHQASTDRCPDKETMAVSSWLFHRWRKTSGLKKMNVKIGWETPCRFKTCQILNRSKLHGNSTNCTVLGDKSPMCRIYMYFSLPHGKCSKVKLVPYLRIWLQLRRTVQLGQTFCIPLTHNK